MVKYMYLQGFITNDQLTNFVKSDDITADEYTELTGVDYRLGTGKDEENGKN